jgi:hypothetical protein
MALLNYILTQLCWLPSLVIIYLLATYLIQNELQVLKCDYVKVAEVMEVYRAVLLFLMALAVALAITLQWCVFWVVNHKQSVPRNADSPQDGRNEGEDQTEHVLEETQNAANDEAEDVLFEDADDDDPAEGLVRFDLTPNQVKLIERLLEEGPPAEGLIRFDLTEAEAALLEQMLEERELLVSRGFR